MMRCQSSDGELDGRHPLGDPRVVDEDVDTAEGLGDLGDGAHDCGFIGHIEPPGLRRAAVRCDLVGDAAGSGIVDVGDGDARTCLCQRQRGDPSDAVAAAGDHRGIAIETKHAEHIEAGGHSDHQNSGTDGDSSRSVTSEAKRLP